MPAWADAFRLDDQDGMLVWASVAILWLAAFYLAVLGLMVLFRPAVARRFLSAFAQTTRANLIETGLRFLAGLAFVGAAFRTREPSVSLGFGLLLAVTAVVLALLPGLHRRFAARVTARLFGWFPLFGLVSLLLAALLLWFIS